jgi:ABC-type transport system involved in multi-copper enzyme maturation permease subunit
MTYLYTVLKVEGLKIRKSKVIWITGLAFTLLPLVAGFFMFVLKNPQLAKSSGLLGAKAQIAGEASWPSYIDLLSQMIAVGGMIVFGLTTTWIFGREYADGTAKDLLALPYSRSYIVMGKFLASLIINLILSTYVIILGILIGLLIGLPQWSLALTSSLYQLSVVTLLTIILATPVAFFASYGRGYLGAMGFVMLTLILSQVITVVGFGDYFPWAIPAIYSGLGEDGGILTGLGLFIAISTSLLGILGTLWWWIFADQY